MAQVYILYSQSIDGYYIGSCKDIEIRLQDHNTGLHTNNFTSRAKDWEIYFLVDDLKYAQARKIEKHIKRMKSKTYITLKLMKEVFRQLLLF